MTAPNPVYKHQTLMLTRRTANGCFRFTPTPENLNIFVYLVLHYAERYKIRLLVLAIMSNHYHLVIDDPEGLYVAFMRDLHAMLTEVFNHLQGLEGPMWANCKPGRERLLDPETVMNMMLYAATNPVKHHIVHNSALWDGVVFSPATAGDEIKAYCPQYLLDEYDSFPAEHKLIIPVPWHYGDRPIAEVREDFRRRRLARDIRLREAYDGRYVGLKRAMTRGPQHHAPPPEPSLNKTFACTPKNLPAALDQLRAFRQAYTRARKILLAGGRPTFPEGTYAMHVWHGFPRAGP